MLFCWESFRSDSTVRNLLRLFATREMAEQYGIRAEKALASRIKGNPITSIRNCELNQNIINNYTYNELNFYTGNFKAVKAVSKIQAVLWGGAIVLSGKEFACFFYTYLKMLFPQRRLKRLRIR